MKQPGYPVRLARAAADARDWLRVLVPQLDAAIQAGQDHDGLLARLRALADTHAESLKAALKAPAVPRNRRNPDSWRAGGLWSVLEGAGGRYQQSRRRRMGDA